MRNGGAAPRSRRATTAVACDRTCFSSAQRARHAELLEWLRGACVGARPVRSGYVLAFEGSTSVARQLVEWIMLERRCCPFLKFEMMVTPGSDPIRLRLTGPDGTRELFSGLWLSGRPVRVGPARPVKASGKPASQILTEERDER